MSLSLKNLRGSPCYGVITDTIIRQRNKAPPKIEKQNMKTRNLLMTIGAAVLAAITINVNAGDALLSPRAAGNQTKVAPAAVADRNLATENQGAAVSPRALGNQTTTVAGVANDVNPVMECHKMIASPKAIQACAANPAGMSGCCKATMTDNTAH
jgi:hypothetical protein